MGGKLQNVVGFLSVLALISGIAKADTNQDRVAELVHLQTVSKDGVVRLDEGGFRRFMSISDPRPYSLMLFFDAHQLRNNKELKLEEIRKEFALMASTYIRHNKGQPSESKVFFCDLEFRQAQGVFQLFGVQTLPHVRYVPMGSGDQHSSMEMGTEFPRNAEGMCSFMTSKTKIDCGEIERPPALTRNQIWALTALLVLVSPFVIKQMIAPQSPLRESRVWLSLALMVYFFSVSGGMHNIIRKMPLFMQDRNNPEKLVFFYQGSGMQLGTEGFVVGFLYTIVGVLLGFVTHFAPMMRSKVAQRVVMLVVITVSVVAVRKVIALDNWKTGYWIHAFWPTRWT
jgi:oligosaccharyltransferase complex subunit gamma